MRSRKLPVAEGLVICTMVAIVYAILFPALHRPISFTKTTIPPIQYQNVKMHVVLSDLLIIVQQQRGSQTNYSRYFQWEQQNLKERRVSVNTWEERPLKEVFQLIEHSASIKFDYLERPYHPAGVGRFIIRDAVAKPENRNLSQQK